MLSANIYTTYIRIYQIVVGLLLSYMGWTFCCNFESCQFHSTTQFFQQKFQLLYTFVRLYLSHLNEYSPHFSGNDYLNYFLIFNIFAILYIIISNSIKSHIWHIDVLRYFYELSIKTIIFPRLLWNRIK